MKQHHTKNKGDLGVAKAYCDLVEKGFLVLFPSSEHSPFDLVAYKENKFIRIQVKYRKAVNGSISIRLENWWADRNGLHSNQTDRNEVDVFCVYCPDTDRCYYFKPQEAKTYFSIRIITPKNNQSKKINLAENFMRVP